MRPNQRCVSCGQAPSGDFAPTQFCEFCGKPLETLAEPAPEKVTIACYRCGKKFETVKGSNVTFCPDCERAVANQPPPPAPPSESTWSKRWFQAFMSGLITPLALAIVVALTQLFFGDFQFQLLGRHVDPQRSRLDMCILSVIGLTLALAAWSVFAWLFLPPEESREPHFTEKVSMFVGLALSFALISLVLSVVRD